MKRGTSEQETPGEERDAGAEKPRRRRFGEWRRQQGPGPGGASARSPPARARGPLRAEPARARELRRAARKEAPGLGRGHGQQGLSWTDAEASVSRSSG